MPVDTTPVGDQHTYHSQMGNVFPYAVLHSRWEFVRTPAVVRAFDASHLVERVSSFTLEGMAIHTVHNNLPEPGLQALLDKEIQKVPLVPRYGRPGTTSWGKTIDPDDGDSDVNPEIVAIYVDPDAPLFPSAETVSNAFGAVVDNLSRGTNRVVSWLLFSPN